MEKEYDISYIKISKRNGIAYLEMKIIEADGETIREIIISKREKNAEEARRDADFIFAKFVEIGNAYKFAEFVDEITIIETT